MKDSWAIAAYLDRTYADKPLFKQEVGGARAVRRADLDQAGARGAHDVGDPELAADLDQLAARDQHLLALGQGGEREHERGRAVVHDERGLRAGERGEQKLRAGAARAALPRRAIDLQVGIAGGRRPTASTARAASGALPRFVWMITPVALITRVWPLVARAAVATALARISSAIGGSSPGRRPPERPRARRSACA